MNDDLLKRYADVIVRAGANVQPGQPVRVTTELGNERLLRAVADRCFELGAVYVEPQYSDAHVVRSRLERAPEETLGRLPALGRGADARHGPRAGGRHLALRARASATSSTTSTRRGSAAGVRPAARSRHRSRTTARSTGRSPACRASGWAREVYPELGADEALARLWEDVASMARLDEDDPVASWRARAAELSAAAERLDGAPAGRGPLHRPRHRPHRRAAARLDLEGRGRRRPWTGSSTSSTCRRRRSSRARTPSGRRAWCARRCRSSSSAPVSTASRCASRADARCRSRPSAGPTCCAGAPQADEGAARLGEVALVDRETRVGRRGRVFLDTLYDENAASHIALGGAYASAVAEEDRDRINDSVIHVDFMIGGDDVDGHRPDARRPRAAAAPRRALADLSNYPRCSWPRFPQSGTCSRPGPTPVPPEVLAGHGRAGRAPPRPGLPPHLRALPRAAARRVPHRARRAALHLAGQRRDGVGRRQPARARRPRARALGRQLRRALGRARLRLRRRAHERRAASGARRRSPTTCAGRSTAAAPSRSCTSPTRRPPPASSPTCRRWRRSRRRPARSWPSTRCRASAPCRSRPTRGASTWSPPARRRRS